MENLVALHGHGFGHRAVAIGGVHAAIEHDQIDRARILALRADDQPGDDRGADDEGDEICREACRHGVILSKPHGLACGV